MKEITSLTNPLIKRVRSLHNSKGRKEHNLYVAEGLRTIKTIVAGGQTPTYVFCLDECFDKLSKVVSVKIITIVLPHVLEKISTTNSPQGIVAAFEIPKQPSAKLTTGAVLAQISDPGNMGTLIRTTAAMGHETVVIVEGCDPWSPKVVQASTGAIAQIKLYNMSWTQLLAEKKDLQLCATVIKDGQKPSELNFSNSLIVIGNEAHGLPKTWIDDCEQKLTLPMPGNTESLNAAIAGSIALYLTK
jgi:TrmH family RNA methyltransferase